MRQTADDHSPRSARRAGTESRETYVVVLLPSGNRVRGETTLACSADRQLAAE